MSSEGVIGFFDSGVGGLSVWKAVCELLPNESTLYIGDTANCPYGGRPPSEVLALARRHTITLLRKGAKIVVVACNTATAAAIDTLREEFPDVPFVGMEPAVKPAALKSKTGVVGVMATEGTFQGRLYKETSARFAKGTNILMCVADEFVELVENIRLSGDDVERIVARKIEPLLAAGADHLVLGCTHFPFLRPVMEKIAAGRAEIIDSSLPVAQQTKRLLSLRGLLSGSDREPVRLFESTGDAERFARFCGEVLGVEV